MSEQPEARAQRIRVVLAEDHHVLRQALHTHLERKGPIQVVAEAGDGRELLAAVETQRPDVLVMDLAMPSHEPIGTTKELRRRFPELKIIILSAYRNSEQIRTLFEIGVDGYVLKDDEPNALLTAIGKTMGGGQWVSPQAAAALAVGLRRRPEPELPTLTGRQQEVLGLMARGLRNEEIAEALTLSENTVRNHIAKIFQALGVSTRVEAVVYALAVGLISLEEVKEQMDGEWPALE